MNPDVGIYSDEANKRAITPGEASWLAGFIDELKAFTEMVRTRSARGVAMERLQHPRDEMLRMAHEFDRLVGVPEAEIEIDAYPVPPDPNVTKEGERKAVKPLRSPRRLLTPVQHLKPTTTELCRLVSKRANGLLTETEQHMLRMLQHAATVARQNNS